jgi:phosphatidylinositol alpha-mannosyltransferase
MRDRTSIQPKRLRILIVVPYDLAEPGGGVKHHALGLANVLRGRGDTVVVAGPTSKPVREPHMVGFRGVVNVQFNGSANRIGIFVNPLSVRRFLRQNRFDIIHVQDPLAPGLPYWIAWLSESVPKICTFHAYAERPSLALRVGHRLSAPWVLSHYQRGLAVSQPAAHLVRGVWRRPLSIVPNGVNTDVFTPAPSADVTHPVDSGRPLRLFFCARLSDERKGFADLLRAYTILREKQIPVALDVAGEAAGPLPPNLPGLTYHGPVSLRKLVERFQACDVLVAPSTGQESFGIILLEAMASGRPIVCSDIEGYRRVVDAKGAYFSPCRSPERLADAIATLAADPELRRSMAIVNRQRALDFDWTHVTAHVRTQYLLALGNRREEALYVSPALHPQTESADAPGVMLAKVYGGAA